jgi:hypothetical protein
MPKYVVFGSNQRGAHGAGAALDAYRYHGAVRGCGEGMAGNSYAIPTKDYNIKSRSLDDIRISVDKFKEFARSMLAVPDVTFEVWRIGCGLAGYTDQQIGPMFADAPSNCILPIPWRQYQKQD